MLSPRLARAATTYFVSPTGKNANPGTKSKPWANLARAAKGLHTGDTLVLLPGRYSLRSAEDIVIPRSGKPGAWVTIKGEPGTRPVLAGRDNLRTAIDLSNCSFVKVEGIEITSDGRRHFRDGIQATSGAMDHIVLRDIKIHHLDEFGVNAGDVDGLDMIDCEITYCGYGSVGGPAGERSGWRNVSISGCTLSWSGHYFQGGSGPSPYDRPDGFGIEPSAGPIEIRNTKLEHNRGDGLDSKAENTVVRNCLIANNSCDGIKLWGTGSRVENCLLHGRGDGKTEPTNWSPIVIHTDKANAVFELVNLAVDDCLGQSYLMHVQYDYPGVPLKLVVRNCVFSARGERSPIFLQSSVKHAFENNLFFVPKTDRVLDYGEREYDRTQITGLGSGNRYGDPLFVSVGFGNSGDYHLNDGSPAIDAGTTNGAPKSDMDGVARPRGNGVDIGPYER